MLLGEVLSRALEMLFFVKFRCIIFSETPQALQVRNSTHIIPDFPYLSAFYTYLLAHIVFAFL